jgi:hypothetical protein
VNRRAANSCSVLAAFAVLATGCVVDEGRTRDLRDGRDGRDRGASAPGQAPGLPDDPIARPVTGGTSVSRVTVSVDAYGPVEYDGLSVPIVSPDGLFIAAQDAPAPPREQRLAIDVPRPTRPGSYATVSISPLTSGIGGVQTSVEVFDLNAPILLGRDASAEGVLIESPRPDGSRWIGVAIWTQEAAQVRWLVRNDAVCAHAVFADAGAILYSRRTGPGARFALVHRERDGAERSLTMPDADLVFPLVAPDRRHATCLAVDDSGAITLLLIDLTTGGTGTPGNELGAIVRRFDLASSGGIEGAAQIVAASQSAVSGLSQSDALAGATTTPTESALGPILFHPGMDRLAAIDARRRSLIALAPKSVAAVDAGDGRALCSTPDGLVLWTPGGLSGMGAGRGTATRVLSEDYLPRRTASSERPFILLAPTRRSATSLMVFGMAPTASP